MVSLLFPFWKNTISPGSFLILITAGCEKPEVTRRNRQQQKTLYLYKPVAMKKALLFLLIAALHVFKLPAQAKVPRGMMLPQDTESIHKKEFTIILGPTYADLPNQSRQNDKYAVSTGSVSFNVGFNYYTKIKGSFGINFGLEFSQYKNLTKYEGAYQAADKSVDRDGNTFYAYRDAHYMEKRTIDAVEIPLLLRYKSAISKHSYWFIDAGVKGHIVALSELKVEGTLEKRGAYPHPYYTNVFYVIQDDPYYDYTKKSYSVKEDMKVSKFAYSLMASIGIVTRLSDNVWFMLSPSYINCRTDLTKSEKDEYENIFQQKSEYKPTIFYQIGLRTGLVLKLK
jgi:hypothetical protein